MIKTSKHTYYLALAYTVASKSIDDSTKCGCVAVDAYGAILSTGYNGPPIGFPDDIVPMTRPEKYIYFEHAERNCIYNAARAGIKLVGCVFYVTGPPCYDCLRAMIQCRPDAIFYGCRKTHKKFNKSIYKELLRNQNIKFAELIDYNRMALQLLKSIKQ